ncbi:MAG: carboxylating nicotinate-nucleotide diphosphorylase [Leptolyngbyaceae bacterium]|nr:carboxylating nicotinate-nucleotide diphosphorylase [Leptolyngbyaceae bacterium]
MPSVVAVLPPWIVLDPLLDQWLREDIGRGDRSTQGIFGSSSLTPTIPHGSAHWIAKQTGIVAGLPIANRIFQRLDSSITFTANMAEGETCQPGQQIATIQGPLDGLLSGERVALNLAMRLSGIATATRDYVNAIAPYPTQFVDTRKTTPGLRLLEKYATQVGGAINHRMGLDDAVMLKDNHIAAAGGITAALKQVRDRIPYPLTIEVETETLEQVKEAADQGADIIMLDNMPPEQMVVAVGMIRAVSDRIKIEASGNITLETIRAVAATGVDHISSSAPITRSPWLDLSMRIQPIQIQPI